MNLMFLLLVLVPSIVWSVVFLHFVPRRSFNAEISNKATGEVFHVVVCCRTLIGAYWLMVLWNRAHYTPADIRTLRVSRWK